MRWNGRQINTQQIQIFIWFFLTGLLAELSKEQKRKIRWDHQCLLVYAERHSQGV